MHTVRTIDACRSCWGVDFSLTTLESRATISLSFSAHNQQ